MQHFMTWHSTAGGGAASVKPAKWSPLVMHNRGGEGGDTLHPKLKLQRSP